MDSDVRDSDENAGRSTPALDPDQQHAAAAAVKSAATMRSFSVGAFAPMKGPGDVMLITRPMAPEQLAVPLEPGMSGNMLTPEDATALGLHLISCAERVRRNRAGG